MLDGLGDTSPGEAIIDLVDYLRGDVLLVVDGIEQLVSSTEGRTLLRGLMAARGAVGQRGGTPGNFLFIGVTADQNVLDSLLVGGVEALPRLASHPVSQG